MDKTDKANHIVSLKVRLLSFLPALLLMGLIYLFSSKTATQSSATSSPIAEFLLSLYEAVFGQAEPSVRMTQLDLFGYLVRKAAHVCEYALLSILLSFHFYCIRFRGFSLWLFATAASTAYAATDEFHQLFVEGRSGQLNDVFIDAIGAMTGAFLFIVVILFIAKLQTNRLVSGS